MTTARTYAVQTGTALLVVVTSLWAATQWAAAMLAYQPALGAPLLDLVLIKLYAPWQLFAWWLAFDAQAPDVFARAGAVAALGGVAAGLVAIGGAARQGHRRSTPATYGSARWADSSDVRKAGLLGRDGVVLGLYGGRYLRHRGPEHVLAVAPTRSGKGVGLVLPTLLTWPGSTIVHDIKGENWQLTAGWRAQFSRCLLFDPTNPLSAQFNPLLEVRKGLNEVRDVQNIADILIDPEGMKPRDHWDKTAYALLTGAILHVLYAEREKTLARVATVLADPSRSILTTLKVMATTNHIGTGEAPMAHPAVASIARELFNKSDNERSGVVSTAMSLMGLYRDPLIAANTARSDWRISDLMGADRPVSLYLAVPPSDISRTRPLVRLILNQIARRLTETLPADPASRRQLLLMLDEFPALGRLDFFETSLAFMAGYGVRAFLVAQSLHQIDRAYGFNHSILDNCHVRVAFAPNDERSARRLSDALGTATELRARKNISGSRLSAWLPHVSMAEEETPRPLLTPGEVLQFPSQETLVMVSGTPPIRARKLQYYNDHNFLARRLPAPELARERASDLPAPYGNDWSGQTRDPHPRLEKAWDQLQESSGVRDDTPPRTREVPLRRRKKEKGDRPLADLPLLGWRQTDPESDVGAPAGEVLERVTTFPGARL
jgi:type IV secretion system protein VirD4